MLTATISLASVEQVKRFAHIARKFDFDVALSEGRYRADGKSILGIFCLNLARPLRMDIHHDDPQEFLSQIQEFLCRT